MLAHSRSCIVLSVREREVKDWGRLERVNDARQEEEEEERVRLLVGGRRRGGEWSRGGREREREATIKKSSPRRTKEREGRGEREGITSSTRNHEWFTVV